MTNERRFFESCAAAISPGWCTQLGSQTEPGQINLASQSVRLYLVDTSTGWVAAGAFTPDNFSKAAQLAKACGLQGTALADAAGQILSQLSTAAAKAGQEVEQGMQLVAAAMFDTRAFQVVKEQGRGLAGHWVYVAYRGHDASTVCRPVFFASPEAGFVQASALVNLVRQVVRQDTQTPGGNVAQVLKRAGGAILADTYK